MATNREIAVARAEAIHPGAGEMLEKLTAGAAGMVPPGVPWQGIETTWARAVAMNDQDFRDMVLAMPLFFGEEGW
jgi:hypothetical protein